MSDYQFPATLKPVVNRGYRYTRGGNVHRTDVQGGLPRQARDTYYDPVPITINLVVSALGLQVFNNFLNLISGGADRFLMNLDTGNGLEEHLVLMTSDANINTQSGVYWYVSFTATAERTSIQDATTEFSEAITELYGQYGDGLNKFLYDYELYVTTPLFINNLPEPS